MLKSLRLAQALGLRPLDRLQINSAAQRQELAVGRRQGRASAALPWWYFQRVTSDGLLEVRSPSGSTEHVSATDVCDIIPGEPVQVQAMPKSVFVRRLARGPDQRKSTACEADFAPAFVRYVRKDRWNRVDQVFVHFLDESLNDSPSFATPLAPVDHERLQKLATRASMPVVGPGYSAASTDKGGMHRESVARHATAAFLESSLIGNPEVSLALSNFEVSPLTTAKINRLMRTPSAPYRSRGIE